jgi:hypothetical protein
MLDQLQALIANTVQSVEEAEAFTRQLAQTDWTAFGIPRSRSSLCNTYMCTGELLQDVKLPCLPLPYSHLQSRPVVYS